MPIATPSSCVRRRPAAGSVSSQLIAQVNVAAELMLWSHSMNAAAHRCRLGRHITCAEHMARPSAAGDKRQQAIVIAVQPQCAGMSMSASCALQFAGNLA